MPNPHNRGTATSIIVGAAREQRRHPTSSEEALWRDLRDRRLAGLKFRRQHPYGSYVLDFFCVERRLCVEADGGLHMEAEQARLDAERSDYLTSEGITVLRVTNADLARDRAAVLRRIAETAAALGAAGKTSD